MKEADLAKTNAVSTEKQRGRDLVVVMEVR